MMFAQVPDPEGVLRSIAQLGSTALLTVLTGLSIYLVIYKVLPWLERKDENFVKALNSVTKSHESVVNTITDSHERKDQRHTAAIEHVAQSVEGVKAEVSRLRDDILERNSQ